MASMTPASADEAKTDRTITISASAQINVEPDAATITSGVTTHAPTARAAMRTNSETVSTLIDELLELGIPKKHIQTSSININPRYDHPKDGSAPKVRGYVVTNDITIESHDLDKLGDILDRLVSLGANRMQGLTFFATDAENLKDGARTKAIENAYRRAQLFASAASAKVGKVLHISEATTHSPAPRQMRMARAAMAESVPIESGEQSLSARVTVTWALED